MKKLSKIIAILTLGSSLISCSERPTRIIVDQSSMGDFVLQNDSADIISVNNGIKNGNIVAVNYGYNILEKKKVNSIYRVVAGPGDNVKIENEYVYINGRPLLPRLVRHTNILVSMDSTTAEMLSKRSNIAFKIPVIGEKLTDSFPISLAGIFTTKNHRIETKYYFLMNDDYTDKNDSRSFGLVPVDSIVGIVKEVHHR